LIEWEDTSAMVETGVGPDHHIGLVVQRVVVSVGMKTTTTIEEMHRTLDVSRSTTRTIGQPTILVISLVDHIRTGNLIATQIWVMVATGVDHHFVTVSIHQPATRHERHL
jgi:hypothetical protein